MIGRTALGMWLLKQLEREGWYGWTIMENNEHLSREIEKHRIRDITEGFELSIFMGHIKRSEVEERVRLAKKDRPDEDDEKADFIVDASGDSLVRHRLAGKKLPRCASIFIDPCGRAGVLLLEDQHRGMRLDQLEAQWFHWLIHHDPDGGEGGADRPGASAQPPPDALDRIANALARRLATLVKSPDPAMIIHQWDEEPRDEAAHCVELHRMSDQHATGWRIVWDLGLEVEVLKIRWEVTPKESGGVILGRVDPDAKAIFVVDFLPPPVDSVWDNCYFKRGEQGVAEAVRAAARRTGGLVTYVGEWHSHPDAMFAIPGVIDLERLGRARDEMVLTGHPPVILIIGEMDLVFHMLMFPPPYD